MRISDIANSELGKTLDRSKNTGTLHNYLCAINVQWDKFDLSVLKTIKLEDSEKERYLVKPGDLLICEGGDVGRSAIWNSEEEIYYQNALHRVRFFGGIVPRFYLYVLQYYKMNSWIDAVCNGVTIKHFTQNKMNSLLFPLPSTTEQCRIVRELHHWLLIIEILDQCKEELQDTIRQTKLKILDLAVHGKLVSQDPDDEPAIELLRRINPNFIPCDNGHYPQLPSRWEVTTIHDVCDTFNGLWKGKSEPFVNVGVIRNANFTKDFTLDYSKIEYIDVETRQFERKRLRNGDIIVEKSGGSDNNAVGRAILYDGQDGLYSLSNFTMALRVKNPSIICSKYLYYYIMFRYLHGDMKTMQTQTTGLHNLILDKYLSMELPLPPLVEQQSIVIAIESWFRHIDILKNSL